MPTWCSCPRLYFGLDRQCCHPSLVAWPTPRLVVQQLLCDKKEGVRRFFPRSSCVCSILVYGDESIKAADDVVTAKKLGVVHGVNVKMEKVARGLRLLSACVVWVAAVGVESSKREPIVEAVDGLELFVEWSLLVPLVLWCTCASGWCPWFCGVLVRQAGALGVVVYLCVRLVASVVPSRPSSPLARWAWEHG